MKEIPAVVLIGQPNVGKSLFLVRFLEYLGAVQMQYQIKHRDRLDEKQAISVQEASEHWVSATPHHTRMLYQVAYQFPQKKGKQEFHLVDTSGLTEEIHIESGVRQGMALSLAVLRDARIVLHMVDVSSLKQLNELDRQVHEYCRSSKQRYAVLANKMDQPQAEDGLLRLKDEWPKSYLIPVSALYQRGFKEVRSFVLGNL